MHLRKTVLKAWEIHPPCYVAQHKNISRVRSWNTLALHQPHPQQTDKTVHSNWKSVLYGNLKLEIGPNFLKADIHRKKQLPSKTSTSSEHQRSRQIQPRSTEWAADNLNHSFSHFNLMPLLSFSEFTVRLWTIRRCFCLLTMVLAKILSLHNFHLLFLLDTNAVWK